MKNKKIRECLHLFYIKIKTYLTKEFNLLFPLPRIKSFLNDERMEYLVHFLYVFFYDHIFYKLYICTRKIRYYEKRENKRMLINANLMKEGTMQVPS
jgi:hypothetical protein